MKIDELIGELVQVKEEHGNLEVDATENFQESSRVFTTNTDKENHKTICWLSI